MMLRMRDQRHAPTGFVMPLAIGASAVLLLGSASLHTLSLQGRLRLQTRARRRQTTDQLRSVGQAFAALASGREACLLQWSDAVWDQQVEACGDADPERLRSGVLDGEPWHLIAWQPQGDGARLRVQLSDGRQAQFRASLRGDGVSLRGLGPARLLQRVAPQGEA